MNWSVARSWVYVLQLNPVIFRLPSDIRKSCRLVAKISNEKVSGFTAWQPLGKHGSAGDGTPNSRKAPLLSD